MKFVAFMWFMIGAIDVFVASQTVVVNEKMDNWNKTTIYGGAMTNQEFYESVEKESICECRLVCDVKPNCTLVSAVLDTFSSKVDCRISTQEEILQTTFLKTNNSVTLYKRVHKFCPADNGIFYWPETQKMTMAEAKIFCARKGGRLAILNTKEDYNLALEAVKYAATGMEPMADHLMLDLQRQVKGEPFIWGNGKMYSSSPMAATVELQFNSLLGIGIKDDSTMKEFDITKELGFLCQYNPLNLDWGKKMDSVRTWP